MFWRLRNNGGFSGDSPHGNVRCYFARRIVGGLGSSTCEGRFCSTETEHYLRYRRDRKGKNDLASSPVEVGFSVCFGKRFVGKTSEPEVAKRYRNFSFRPGDCAL